MKSSIFIIFLPFIFVISSCINRNYLTHINKNIHVDNCNINNAKIIADSIFEVRIGNIKDCNINVYESDTCYKFYYIEKNPRVMGGGGEIFISKRNCKVISIIGYQ